MSYFHFNKCILCLFLLYFTLKCKITEKSTTVSASDCHHTDAAILPCDSRHFRSTKTKRLVTWKQWVNWFWPTKVHFSGKILYMFPWCLYRDNSNYAQHRRPRQPLTPFLIIKLNYPVTGHLYCLHHEQSPPKQPQCKQMSQSKHTFWVEKSEREQMICLA